MMTAALVALTTAPAIADTYDPLHGYAVIGGTNVNTDTGAISPIGLGTDSVNGFGFFISPAPQTDTERIVVLEPTGNGATPVSLLGNIGGGTPFVSAGTWTTGDLAGFLGLTPSSPANPFSAFSTADTANPGGAPTGFNVFVANIGTQTELSLMNSTMVDNLNGGVVAGAEITAFSTFGTEAPTTISTAPSGVLMQTASVSVPGPIVGAGIPGLVTACIGLVGLARRRRQRWLAMFGAAAH
jgi:hypothetical protein